MTTTPEKLLEYIKERNVKWVNLQFMDIPGYIQHITIPPYTLKEEDFTDGIGKLDGSSIKGFKSIFESDMRMFPDPGTCAILPWTDNTPHRTLRLFRYSL